MVNTNPRRERMNLKSDTWKHIRSAPKDDTNIEILLYCKAKGAYVGWWDVECKCWLPKYIALEECDNCSAWVPEPTYWCELPNVFHM